MATRFEIVLPGTRTETLRAAGEEALAEIERIESWLSVHRPGTPLAAVNAGAYRQRVPVSPPIFELLKRAQELSRLTNGAFDPTIGPLVSAWRRAAEGGTTTPKDWEQSLATARAAGGWLNVELDEITGTVRFHHPNARLDLGSIGKGWALDRAVTCLRDAGITTALLHGGTSTVCAIGTPPDGDAWIVELADAPVRCAAPSGPEPIRERVRLRDASLSVSATWGRTLVDPFGKAHGHVLDPNSGEPVPGARLAAVAGPAATETDALSTALLVAGRSLIPSLQAFHPCLRFWLN